MFLDILTTNFIYEILPSSLNLSFAKVKADDYRRM